MPSSMSVEEANIAAQIAHLEAELEKAKLESQLKKLQSQLREIDNGGESVAHTTKQGSNHSNEYLVIEDGYEYNEDDGYYEEEYIEEYEEEYYTDEEYEEEIEEVVEEFIDDEQEVAVPPTAIVPEQHLKASLPVPKPLVYNNLHQAHSNLRKTPNNVIQQELTSNPTIKDAATSSTKKDIDTISTPVTQKSDLVEKTQTSPTVEPKMKTVTKVRPPPSQGGKPIVRVEPQEVMKTNKKFPLSGLIRRTNNKSTAATDSNNNETDDGTYTKKVVVTKRGVPKKPQPPTNDSSLATSTPIASIATASGANSNGVSKVSVSNFQRRMIPNLQPSSEGNETIFEQLLGPKLLVNAQLQKCTTRGCVKDQELIGLFFGAAWKTDCKRFMKLLKEFYYATANQHQFEIIYISADRSLIEFKDVYKNMPYLALPAGTTSYKNELTKALKINEMPSLVILDDEANVVSVQGVQRILELDHSCDAIFYEQSQQLMEKWKKTRPISFEEVKRDNTLLYNTIDRGTVYWN